ncbi:DoxX family protein [Galactobacter sp.]|uniref:DoxX family protein n=1 Tax=Galactobacter sp. TaxID=2676125 RepID=UPI0025C467DF|nr:DoxX family protein [Galactobacter sp.]
MLIALWIINILLALVMLGAGGMKLAKTKDDYVKGGMGWAENVSSTNIKLIGLLEVIGAVGLILPLALDIAAVLSPIAAIGLAIIMIGAVFTHLRRKEGVGMQVVLVLLAAASAVIGFIEVL